MLNIIWCFFIIISIIYGITNGNANLVNQSIFDSMKQTMALVIGLCGSMCFWSGMMNIVRNTSFIVKINKLLNPVIHFLFKEIDEESECYKNISLNITSNLLGLGNSATPCGLKAMEELQKNNKSKNRLTNSQLLFILINTASIQLIPTTMISIRASLGSKNPSVIMISVWFASACAFAIMILITKVYFRFRKI